MRSYTIRYNGTMIAKIFGSPANKMLHEVEGFWRGYQPTNDKRSRCFEITEDTKFGIDHNGNGLQVYLWKGTLIIED